MPDNSQPVNSQSLVIDFAELNYETVAQANGQATVIRFQVDNPRVIPGDVLVVLAGEEIHFHGFINNVAEGWATAADPNGSQLPARVS